LKNRRRFIIVTITFALLCTFFTPYPFKALRRIKWMVANVVTSIVARKPIAEPPVIYTAEDQIDTYGASARARLMPKFQTKGVAYPPQRLTMVVIKSTKELMLYAADADSSFKYICTYPILAASGVLGPKLKEGDCQVPEGLYNLTLEPNTPYHLALRLNYPNPSDWARAKEDGREQPGSDILVHGNQCSIGCIAMGDPVSEELFVAAYDTADKELPLIIAPVDFRTTAAPESKETDPNWLPELYGQIKAALAELPQ
jgi:murein L,D-transpeptidase YafK